MARNYRLKERGTGVTLYPETTTEQVYVPGGDNLKNLLPRMQEQINAKQPSEPGKGLSANDYTNDDKAAVGEWTEWKDSLFTIKGQYVRTTGVTQGHASYSCTGLIPINHDCGISWKGFVAVNFPAVVFYDANMNAIGSVVDASGSMTSVEIPVEDIPAAAVYFRANCQTTQIRPKGLAHTSTLEAEQGATAQAIQMGKVALFDDMFTQAVGANGKVDHSHVDEDSRPTPYLCNGIWLTYEEAVEIYNLGTDYGQGVAFRYERMATIKTVLPFHSSPQGISTGTFRNCYSLLSAYTNPIIAELAFSNCHALQTITGTITRVSGTESFKGCEKLQDVTFKLDQWTGSFSLADSPLLKLETMQSIPAGASSRTAPITITVHPDVYAKLTDETNAEWHKVLTDALARNISFATV